MSQNNSYLALARKYRPQNFDELVGQEVLVQTLTNAIKNNRFHHAYILTGIRGVGKTTTARIIAKTLNCMNPEFSSQARSCGVCENCRLIAASKHQDVIEIDAASRTGVDDVREIISAISYAPVSSKYKIYIIDEFHMLSNQAFNALLKTLEEPPSHVKFIFATTEIKKVPLTILSRCQRFDLRRLDEEEIAAHLENILQKENFEFEKDAIFLIAKASEGSVRDALSLLDQALASEKKLTSEYVEKMLGLNDKNHVIELLQTLLKGDVGKSIEKFSEIYSSSSDVINLVNDLMEIVHKITSAKLIENYKLEGYSQFQKEKMIEISKNISLNSLIRIWQMLVKGLSELSIAISSKIAFEMLIVRICHVICLPNLQEILLNSHKSNKPSDTENSDDVISEILQNFEGAKILN